MRMNKISLNKAGFLILACLIFLTGCNKKERFFVHKTNDGGYVLFVEGKPFLMKGMTYNPAPIGAGYDYDLFADPNKPWLVDGPMMKEMGVNCIRVYSVEGKDMDKVKAFISDMYEKFGIYTIIGDWLGMWAYPGPNYANCEFQQTTKAKVLEIVKELKDEPGVLCWVLGNENNYTFSGNICFWTSEAIECIDDPAEKIEKRAEIYYKFVNDIAKSIKEIDPVHPVALGNGEMTFLNIAAKYCQDIDWLAIIAYRGKKFGNFFNNLRNNFDKPIFLSEFGADSYDSYREQNAQDWQSKFIASQWNDLMKNTVFSGNSKGNCLGGVVFEWTDEWWKHNEGYCPDWQVHNKEAGWSNGSYYFDVKAENNLNMSEEYFGLFELLPEKENGINKRKPKMAFETLKELWSKKYKLSL